MTWISNTISESFQCILMAKTRCNSYLGRKVPNNVHCGAREKGKFALLKEQNYINQQFLLHTYELQCSRKRGPQTYNIVSALANMKKT